MNGPEQLTDDAARFLAERHLATLTSLRRDGTPHVVAVGFSWDAATRTARVITDGASVKAVLGRRGGAVALCQVDGARWLTLEGTVGVSDDPARVADAVERYTERYRPPRVNPTRVVLEIAVTRVLGSGRLIAGV